MTFDEYDQYLNEGLIKTYSLNMLHKTLYRFLASCDCPLRISPIEYNNTLELYLPVEFKKLISSIVSIGNQHGYFIPGFLFMNNNEKTEYLKTYNDENIEDFSVIVICFESKYDIQFKDLPEYIYHVTLKDKIEKIKKIGLSPKSKNKLSVHPSRIYCTINLEDAKELITRFKNISNKKEDDYVILKIITLNLKNNFYEDPNYKENTGQIKGIYTIENISSSNIII